MNSFKYLLFGIPLIVSLWFINLDFNKTNTIEDAGIVWLNDVDEAYKISKKTKKPILANFTGSDWCGWCHKLSAEVFNTPEFKKWSDKNVVLLELDFPKRKELPEKIKAQNNSLMQAFQVQGFPTIWVFNMNQDKETKKFSIEAIGKTGYIKGGPVAFTDAIESMFAQQKEQKKNAPQGLQPAKP